MAYLDETGLTTLWSKIKNKFAHSINLTTDDSGAAITLVSGDGTSLATKTIPCATTTTGGLLTNAQAQSIANIKSYSAGTGLRLDGTTFSHATGTGYNHIPTGGSSGQILKWSSAGTAQWADEYSYTLPTATATTLGGIKVGDNLSISDGVLSADVPTTLPNPKALTLNKLDTTLTYDGSSAVTIDIPTGIFIAAYGTTAYTELLDAYNANKMLFLKHDSDEYFQLSTWDNTNGFEFTSFDGHEVDIARVKTDGTYSMSVSHCVTAQNINTFTAINHFEKTITVPTPTTNTSATNKSYVDNAIATAISGSSKYGGTVASEDDLLAKSYTTGTYYVVSVPSGSTWEGYENGDMFFAKADKGTSGSLDDFDCVQSNITAMTDTEINSICTLD